LGPARECCGYAPPDFCHDPDFLHEHMGEYYPEVTYYLANPDLATGHLQLEPVRV
jgi:hypothetical protein